MNRYQRKLYALGSDVVLTIVGDNTSVQAATIFTNLENQITAFEKRFSRFLPASELNRFNQSAGHRTAISPAFKQLLTTTKRLAETTNGLFNPFVLPRLQTAGYIGSWPHPETVTSSTDYRTRSLQNITGLTIGDTWAAIPETAALDFGGIGKGYLLDQLALSLGRLRVKNYWLSLGGDIICAGHDSDNSDWQIGIQHAFDEHQVIDTISNHEGRRLAIATSGISKRRGVHNEKHWHHLIDPRTGEPATTGIIIATVTAERATHADIYAKCIVIAGAEAADTYVNSGVISSYVIQTSSDNDTIQTISRSNSGRA